MQFFHEDIRGKVLNKNILMNDSLVFEKEVHTESAQENFVNLNQFDPDIIVDPTLLIVVIIFLLFVFR